MGAQVGHELETFVRTVSDNVKHAAAKIKKKRLRPLLLNVNIAVA